MASDSVPIKRVDGLTIALGLLQHSTTCCKCSSCSATAKDVIVLLEKVKERRVASDSGQASGVRQSPEVDKLMTPQEWAALSSESRHKLNVYLLASAPAVDRAGVLKEAARAMDKKFPRKPWIGDSIRVLAHQPTESQQFNALATEFDDIGLTEMDAITPEFTVPADAGKELRALSAKWHGPIGDGGKGWADEDKIYWCREVRNQCAEELDAVLASLRVKVEELWNAHAGDGWSGDAVCVDERFKDTVLALLGEGEKHAPI